MSNVLLQHCLGYADRVEKAVLDLGIRDGVLAALPARCAAFRDACRSLASNRGLARVTLAFVGPRNAGKTTLASLLIRDAGVRAELPVGVQRTQSTRRILWIGPERPADLDDAIEAWIPCPAESLEAGGLPYQVADVPGFNDRVAETRAAAARALEGALVHVLVVDERNLEAHEVHQYLREADGAVVLPVINRAASGTFNGSSPSSTASDDSPEACENTGEGTSDAAAFAHELRTALRHGQVLEPIVVPDFRQRGQDENAVLRETRDRLIEALRTSMEHAPELASRAAPQLRARLERFRAETERIARTALPATASAVTALGDAEQTLPHEVLGDTLGSDRALMAVLRQRLRAVWLDNTPALLFPWRIALAVTHLVWGAIDRLPLLLMGSVPSLVSVAWTAVRNVRRAEEFRELTTSGLRQHAARRAAERLAPLVRSLHESLAADLGHPLRGVLPTEGEPVIEGVGALQERSAAVFEETIERHAPGRMTSKLLGGIGFLAFWAVACWPLYAVYLEYGRAALGTWAQSQETLRQFPTPTFSLALTTLLLGLLPLAAWLLVAATWLTRAGKMRTCCREVRLAHEALIRELLAAGLLRVRLANPSLAACRVLLAGGERSSDSEEWHDSPSASADPALP